MAIFTLTIMVFMLLNPTSSPFRPSHKWGGHISFSSPCRLFIFPLLFFFQGIFHDNYNLEEMIRLESNGNNKFVFTSRVSEYSEAGAALLLKFITAESKI